MKKALPFLIAEIVLSFLVALLMTGGFNKDLGTFFGLANLILGIIGLVIGVIFSIAKEENTAKGLLISSALLLLMGFLTCSLFPMNFGH